MKRINRTAFVRLIVPILLIALLGAFYEGAFEKAAGAQQQYPAPVITSVSPKEAEIGKSVELSILGKYLVQGATLSFSPPTGISLSWVKVLSPEKMSAEIVIAKDAPIGARDVTVTNPDKQSHTVKGAFYLKAPILPPPVIISLSPSEAKVEESIELNVTGKYFLQGAKLSFSPPTGISLSSVKVLSSEKMSAGIVIAKDAPIGARDVMITNPDGQSYTAKGTFYLKAAVLPSPVITSISPSEAEVGKTLELGIMGKYFLQGAKLSFSPPTGISLSSVKVLSPEKMSAGIAIAKDAPIGTRAVTVTNPDGQSYTAKGVFYVKAVVVPSPIITSVSPGEAEVDKAAVLPDPVITNIPVENKVQQLRKTLHRLITGLANKAGNWLASLKIRMTDKESIQDSTFSEIKPSLEGKTICLEPAIVNYQTLYVSQPKLTGKRSIDSNSDGSLSHPFPTIAEALVRAEELNYEGIEIIVSRGTYTGDLIITRPTKITGESRTDTIIVGSIINHSIYSLSVNSLSINGPKAVAGEVGKEGALIISNACASTTLERVDIKSPLNYGILQSGGNLTARNVRIEDTAASESIASSGTAVHLSNVDAILNGILIERAGRFAIRQIGGSLHMFADHIQNTRTRDEISKAGTGIWTSDGAKTEILSSIINGSQSSALIIEGSQTEAVLENVDIYDTKVNPWLMRGHILTLAPDLSSGPALSTIPIPVYPSAFAAIQVQQEAQLLMNRSRVTNNEYMGLRVVDNAQARITNTRFSHTRGYVGSESGSWTYGTNIQAKNNGHIYLENVTSQHADLCGLQLYGGTVDYHVGEVSYNLVGVHITTAGFDIRRLQDRVAYFANGLDLDMATLPVPEPSVPAAD